MEIQKNSNSTSDFLSFKHFQISKPKVLQLILTGETFNPGTVSLLFLEILKGFVLNSLTKKYSKLCRKIPAEILV